MEKNSRGSMNIFSNEPSIFNQEIEKTGEKEYNEKLKKSAKKDETKFRFLHEHLSEGITIYDTMFRHTYLNPAFGQIWGISTEEYAMKTDRELGISHRHLKHIETNLKKVFKTGEVQRFELELDTYGDSKYYNTCYIPEFSEDNSVKSIYVIMDEITLLKSKEDEIEFQADIISQVKDAIITVDHENHILYWNKGAEKLFGFKFQEVEGETLSEVIGYQWLSPEDKKHAVRQLEITGTWYGENICFNSNGEKITIESSVKAFYDKGNYIGTLLVMHDVTEPVMIKKTLEKNYKQLHEAQRIGHIGNWDWDIQNNVITWSDELYNIYGLDPNVSGAKFDSILNLVHPEDHNTVDRVLSNALENHKSFDYEFRICRPDGDIRVISCQGEVITDFAGHPLKIICVEQDITERKKIEESLEKTKNELEVRVEKRTRELKAANELLKIELEERKRAEKELKNSEKNLANAQKMAHIGNWNWNIDTNQLAWSSEIYRIFKLDPDNFDSKFEAFLRLVHPDDRDFVNDSVKMALNKKKSYCIDHSIILPENSQKIVRNQAEVVLDNDGEVVMMMGTIQDITDIKKAEESQKILINELKRSNKELQQFAYVASHDLQEPLRTVTSFAQLIERRYKDKLDSDADDFIEYIVDASKRMQILINDLLDYSRVTTKGKEFKPTDIEEIFKNVITNLHAAISANKAKITHDELPVVNADSGQLLQLFQNLIGNAIKFKKENESPEIHISARKEENEYVFSVQDNGIGIEEEYLKRIFTIFQRLHTREEYGGTGIGLAVAKKIVERHGGCIWIESEYGKGSTFYFTISSQKSKELHHN